MKSRWSSIAFVLILSSGILFAYFSLLNGIRQAVAAPDVLSVIATDPNSSPNDLNTALVITGTGFIDGATAKVGDTTLQDVMWINATRLDARLPWGVEPGVYTLTVTNPGGASASLPEALTVEQGIGVWTENSGPEGGLVQRLAIHPHTPSLLFAVSSDGGLLRSQDSGANWELSLNQLRWAPSFSFGADGHTVYASVEWEPVNLWRSDDNGLSWQPIPIPDTNAANNIVAHPTQADTVFATIAYQDGGREGLYRSVDRGIEWVQITQGISGKTPSVIAIDPVHPLTMALGMVNGEIYLSTDGGESWSFASQALPGRIGSLAFHPSGSGELWVTGYFSCDGVVKSSSPDLSSWIPVQDGGGTICTNYVALAPLAWGEAYSQTVFYHSYMLRMSSDGGLNWADYGGLAGNSVYAIALHPTDPQTIYVGSWQGVQATTDGGTTWQVLDHGLTGLAPEVLEVLPDQPENVYAQNNEASGIYKGEMGGAAWSFLPITPSVSAPANQTTAFTIDPNDPQRNYLAGHETILISTDGGQTWPFTTMLPIPPEFPSCAHWTTKLAADPFSPGVLLAGVEEACGNWGSDPGGLYLSTDFGETWMQRMVGVPISQVNDIAFDWGNPGTVYAAAAGSGALRSTNSGLTWQPVNNGLDPRWGGVIIETETTPPYRVYYSDGPYLYMSADQGDSWSRIPSPDGGNNNIQLLHFTHGNPSVLYLASASGLYASTDGGSTWKRTPEPLGIGMGMVWSLGSGTPDARTVLYAAGVGRVYRLTSLPVELSGTITDSDSGLPLQGAQVLIDSGYITFTNSAGVYSFTLPTGVYSLTVSAGGYISQTVVHVELVMQPVVRDFALIPIRVELSGQVSDAYYGTPIEGAELILNTGDSTFTDPAGFYSFSLEPGVYTLTAQADGYISRTVAGLELLSEPVMQNFLLVPPDALPKWSQVNLDGFGSPDYQISVLEVYQPVGSAPYLYAGVWGTTDTKMWRTRDGWNWEVASPIWVTPTVSMMDAQVFHNQLYLGMIAPTQLWRTDGESWQAVDTVGFGDPNNNNLNALAVFGDKLYAAVLNNMTGVEIWRSNSGDPGTWAQVNNDGFGGWGANDVVMDFFQGRLYVGFGLFPEMGSQLWRTSDGTNWEAVFTDGLGYENNGRISMAKFNGELYISFRNVVEGGQIWRSSNGVDWSLVVQGGFDDVNNGRPYGLIVADKALYVVFSNSVTGAQVWRTFDGAFWQRANLDGWGDPGNTFGDYNDKAAAVFNNNLYIGTLSSTNGGEIWRLQLTKQVYIPLVER